MVKNTLEPKRVSDFVLKINELLNSVSCKDIDRVYSLFEELLFLLTQDLNLPEEDAIKKKGFLNVEELDNVVDEVSDAVGSKYIVIDLWERLWELKVLGCSSDDDIKKLLVDLKKFLEDLPKLLSRKRVYHRKRRRR